MDNTKKQGQIIKGKIVKAHSGKYEKGSFKGLGAKPFNVEYQHEGRTVTRVGFKTKEDAKKFSDNPKHDV